MSGNDQSTAVSRWKCLELSYQLPDLKDVPPQAVCIQASLKSPSGRTTVREGFWDGGDTWRLRLSPDEEGTWTYTVCAAAGDTSRELTSGGFTCTPPEDGSPFDRHGPVRVDGLQTHLLHDDGTPFFWMADTAWNGPLRSTDEEWDHYLGTRTSQRYTAVQWIATQWHGRPEGDIEGQVAYTGKETIQINPAFFQRMDRRIATALDAGLLPAPVMMWAIGSQEAHEVNPGYGLPEDQAIFLGRYMVARWGAYPVVWILGGDGNYREEKAERWKRIGSGIFGDNPDAPVAMHCGGKQWIADEFRNESWMQIVGYQSGHGDSDAVFKWIVAGQPATDWRKQPRQFQLNMEPCYENHIAYESKQPHTPHSVRRAVWWSLLNAPTGGVTYGGHGVWGWDDGTGPPVGHGSTGTPLPWREAIRMPAGQQMAHVTGFFSEIDWWLLRPAPYLLSQQPGETNVGRHVAASISASGDLAVVYVPVGGTILLDARELPADFSSQWYDPRTGLFSTANPELPGRTYRFATPDGDDWVLLIRTAA